jgi:hypothetical protein
VATSSRRGTCQHHRQLLDRCYPMKQSHLRVFRFLATAGCVLGLAVIAALHPAWMTRAVYFVLPVQQVARFVSARERDSVVSTKYRRKVSKRPSGDRTRKLSPSVHSSGSNTQPSKRSNGLADGAFCPIPAALRQSTIRSGNIDLRMRICSVEQDALTAASGCFREAYQGDS